MDEPIFSPRATMSGSSRPALRPHIKLRHDAVRNRWVLLGPERILTPNEQACDVLRLCDGERSVSDIATILSESYDASPAAMERDILGLLADLIDQDVVR